MTQLIERNGGSVTMGDLLDNPIYPPNVELYNDFVDEYGFYEEDYISYLVRNSHGALKQVYDGEQEVIRRRKKNED